LKFLTLFSLIIIILNGCFKSELSLPEVDLLEKQYYNLWKAQAHLYLPIEFNLYQERIKKAKNHLREIESKLFFLRDYNPVQKEFIEILKQGEELSKSLEIELQRRSLLILQRINKIEDKIKNLNNFTLNANEGINLRRNLTKSEILLYEGRSFYERGRYIDSEEKLNNVEKYLDESEKKMSKILNRFKEINQIEKWKKWAKEAIHDSKKGYSILIIKIERKMIIYKDEKPVKIYPIGLGLRGLSDKYHAKDYATPEGRYKVIRKNPKSKYYKALLINYPNEEDIREFYKAKTKGLIPKTAKIGGLIEIHGGGSNSITYGCISLDNEQMEELYGLVDEGVPVTIVGALN